MLVVGIPTTLGRVPQAAKLDVHTSNEFTKKITLTKLSAHPYLCCFFCLRPADIQSPVTGGGYGLVCGFGGT